MQYVWRWKTGDLQALPDDAAAPFACQVAGDWATAARLWTERSCPYEAARARAESDDADALRNALATFERLGARPLLSATSRRLRDLGVCDLPHLLVSIHRAGCCVHHVAAAQQDREPPVHVANAGCREGATWRGGRHRRSTSLGAACSASGGIPRSVSCG